MRDNKIGRRARCLLKAMLPDYILWIFDWNAIKYDKITAIYISIFHLRIVHIISYSHWTPYLTRYHQENYWNISLEHFVFVTVFQASIPFDSFSLVTSPPEGVARYCFHPVCMCVCVCVCVCVYLCVRPIFWYFISRLLEEILFSIH